MRFAVERESGEIFLAFREIDGKTVTVRMRPQAANAISALTFQAAQADEDFSGSEITIHGEIDSQAEKSP